MDLVLFRGERMNDLFGLPPKVIGSNTSERGSG